MDQLNFKFIFFSTSSPSSAAAVTNTKRKLNGVKVCNGWFVSVGRFIVPFHFVQKKKKTNERTKEDAMNINSMAADG